MLYLSKQVLFFRHLVVFLTGSKKNPKKLIYFCRTDIVPILLKRDYFVLLAEGLPVFLVAHKALEVLGHA